MVKKVPWKSTRDRAKRRKMAEEMAARGFSSDYIATEVKRAKVAEANRPTPIYREACGFHMDSGVYDPRKPHPGYRRVEE